MSASHKSNVDPQRLGVVLVIAFILFLVVGALPEMIYSREPGGGIRGLISLCLMGSIGVAPSWFTYRMRKSGRSCRRAFLLPVGCLLALVVFFSFLEISQILPSGGVMGLFPVSFLFGMFCTPLALLACGLTAAVTEPAEKRGVEAQQNEGGGTKKA